MGDARTDEIVERVLSRKPTCGSTRVVAIDGPAGSGKTTLAGEVADELTRRGQVVVLHRMDDQYDDWAGLDPQPSEDLARRVVTQVLAPLAEHRPARWQRYDWHAGCFDGWETFDPPGVLVLEGCGSGARDYDPFTTLLVWVQADRDERVRRGIARDGERVLDHWLAWMDSEQAHFARHATRDRADLRVSTD